MELRKLARQEQTSPIYNQAFEEFRGSGQIVNIQPVLEDITLRLRKYPANHPAAKALRQFSKDISENSGDLEKLHGVKETIDTRIANFSTGKPTSAINKANAEANAVQDLLVRSMEDSSTTYRRARQAFIEASGPINELRDSIIGKLSDIPDDQLKRVSSQLLNPAETNSEVIRSAKRVILRTDGGLDAWNQIVRTEMERRLGMATRELNDIISGEVPGFQNVPAQLIRALGLNKSKTRKALMTALSPTQRRNLEFVEQALNRAAQGRPGGSQTGVRQEISQRFNRGFVSAMRRFLQQPLTTVTEIGEEGARSARIRAVSDAVFDETWSPQLAEIRALRGQARQGEIERRMIDLFNQVEQSSIAQGLIQATREDE